MTMTGVVRLAGAIGLVGLIATGASAADAGFVYALQDVPGAGNQIYGFRLDSSGTLTLLPGFPVASGGMGTNNTLSERIAYLNGRLYVINGGNNTLSAFTVSRTTGALTALPFSPIALGSGSWYCVAVHPTGSPVVVGDSTGSLASFAITATTATAAPGSPFATGTPTATAYPFSCAFSRDGSDVYTGGNIGRFVAGFGVNASTGVLTALSGSPFDSGASSPVAYAADASGRLFSGNWADGQLRVFTTSGGVLQGVTGNPFASGMSSGVHGVLHPSGFYLVADRIGNQVGVYRIGGSASATTLSAVSEVPFASGGTLTDALALTPDGGLLVAANGDSRNLRVFGVNGSTGGLTSLVLQPANTLGASGRITGLALAPAPANTALVLSTTVSGLASSIEAQEASRLGLGVEFATPASWAAKTTADFASYRAIIMGDPTCSDVSAVAAAVTNSAVWSPAISGNVIINGTDPAFHAGGRPGALTLIQRGVDYAAAQVGKTGLYLSLSCYYEGATPNTPVPLLSGLGSFTVVKENLDDAHIVVPSHPALTGLTDALLSNWVFSIHEGFNTWPSNFQVLAIQNSVGTPYILARLLRCATITLSPLPNPTSGVPYNQTITQSGGVGATTFAVTSGAPPSGLTLSSAGVLSGTPTSTGPVNIFIVTATDANGCKGSRAYGYRASDDFDGDGKSDVVVYRPSSGTWYVLRSSTSYTTYTSYVWGILGDVPLQGDFDGDGRADVAAYRPSTGTWYILLSSTGYATYVSYHWGITGDIPVPGDYDGDGKTDVVAYRPSNGGWYILQSSTNYTTYVFYIWGLPGDIPVPGDYDGDGKAEVAVYRPSSGTWYALLSSTGYATYVSYPWGVTGDMPVTGDFDGDGKTDFAVYRPSSGAWYIVLSSVSYSTAYLWGLPGDIPVQGDFDGDGKTDVVVYRPSNGTWYILLSTTNYTGFVSYIWGLPGDTPIPKHP